MPIISSDLTAPGYLERAVLNLLMENIGIGKYPNQNRTPEDVAAAAMSLANQARTQESKYTSEQVRSSLGIKTDFGRLAQAFPVNESTYLDRSEEGQSISNLAIRGGIHIVSAPPGYGKSYELTKLEDRLNYDSIVARHYCYLSPSDLSLIHI